MSITIDIDIFVYITQNINILTITSHRIFRFILLIWKLIRIKTRMKENIKWA